MPSLTVTPLIAHGLFQAMAPAASDAAVEITLVKDGHPNATIVMAAEPTPAANLAARELQHHIHQMTGAFLPIASAPHPAMRTVVFVGESHLTRELGHCGEDFESQEYLIQFRPNMLFLMGRDWKDTPENRSEMGRTTLSLHCRILKNGGKNQVKKCFWFMQRHITDMKQKRRHWLG